MHLLSSFVSFPFFPRTRQPIFNSRNLTTFVGTGKSLPHGSNTVVNPAFDDGAETKAAKSALPALDLAGQSACVTSIFKACYQLIPANRTWPEGAPCQTLCCVVKCVDPKPLDLGTHKPFRDANKCNVYRLQHKVLLGPFKGWCGPATGAIVPT